MNENMSTLIEQKINKHGELHLDQIQTQLLVSWLKNLEQFSNDAEILMNTLKRTVLNENTDTNSKKS